MTRHTITQRVAGSGGPRRQVAAAGGTIILVALVIGIVVSAGTPASSKGQSSGSTATGATTVQRRNLIQTDTESGTLGYANAQTVFNRLSGTITFLPSVGQVVSPGGTLYQVDGYPVILFNGSYPAFRVLTSGVVNGPDIKELNADLKAMGFDPGGAITVDQTWQAATTTAVERFQASIGQTQTGTISLGQIVFLPGSQLVNAVDTTLGSTGASAGAGSGSGTGSSTGASNTSNPTSTPTNASYRVGAAPHAQFVDLTTSSARTPTATTTPTPPTRTPTTTTTAKPPTTTPTTTTTAKPPTTTPTATSPLSSTAPGTSGSSLEAIIQLLRTQNQLLQAELKAAKATSPAGKSATGASGSGSARSGGGAGGAGSASAGSASSSGGGAASSGAGTGSSAAGATAILKTTSTKLVVTVNLDATKQSEAKLREPVTVQLPDGSTVNGTITGVSPVATTTSSGSSSSAPSTSAPAATIPVTISLDKRANTRGLDQAAVSVNFAAQVANNVLSVPVTALLATQGGGYAVQLATPPNRLVAVTPGLFAAGFVQITGPGVQDGMQVTDSQG